MDNTQYFIVVPYHAKDRKPCWKMQVRQSFAGKKVTRYCQTEAEGYQVGNEVVDKIRAKGTQGLDEKAAGGMSMKAACEMFKDRNAKKSKSHREKVIHVCDEISSRFISINVAPTEITSWFDKVEGSETTRSTYYRYVRMFFRWAYRMKLATSDPSEVLDAPKAKPGRKILLPAEMKALLKLEMTDWMRAAFLLGGFAGLRTVEIIRMNWEDVDTKTGQIHIRPGVIKETDGWDERIVEFKEPLTRRKSELKGKGKLIPLSLEDFHEYRRDLIKRLKWEQWPKNCLRHSFATYHLAECKNPSLTAFQMGHTDSSMVQRTYAVPARKAAWKEWWEL